MVRGLKPDPEAEVTQEVLAAFAAHVRELRKRAGLNMAQLADTAGLSRSYVFAVENDGANLTFEGLVRLARALGVGLRDLMPETRFDTPAASVSGLREETQRLAAALEANSRLLQEVAALRARLDEVCARLDQPTAPGEPPTPRP